MLDKKIDFKLICKYFLLVAIFVQSVFAIAWFAENIGVYRESYVSNNYILASKSLVVDDNLGILYAIFVKAFGHGAVLKLLQLLLVALTSYYAFKSVLFMAFTVTNPFVLSACFEVNPNALYLAGILTIVMLLRGFVRKKGYLELIFIVLVQVALGFLNPEYAWVDLVLLLPIFLCVCVTKRKVTGVLLLLSVIAASGLCFCANEKISDVHAYGGVEKTYYYYLFQRVVYGHIGEYDELALVYHDVDLSVEMREADKVAELVSVSFARELEKVSGCVELESFFKYISSVEMTKGFSYYGKPIVIDFLYYALSPLSVAYIYLAKITDTLVANSLASFIGTDRVVFGLYVGFSIIISVMMVVYPVIAGIIGIIKRRKVENISLKVMLLWTITVASLYGALMCLPGFDYRNALIAIAFWPAFLFINSSERE